MSKTTFSTYSQHIYKDSFWVTMSVIINQCVILRCNTNTSHMREQKCILHFHTICFLQNLNQRFCGGLTEHWIHCCLWLHFLSTRGGGGNCIVFIRCVRFYNRKDNKQFKLDTRSLTFCVLNYKPNHLKLTSNVLFAFSLL